LPREDDERPGTITIDARIRQSVTKKAVQKHAAMPAVMMKFRGDTSHDVSDTMRAKASALKSIANRRAQGSWLRAQGSGGLRARTLGQTTP
jgi:hypothetical protein